MSTDVNAVEDVLNAILDNYCTDVREAVNTTTEKAANELKKAIAADAPVKSGKQKRSWRVTKNKVAGIDLVAIVHSTDYRKVHLLENGHLSRDGITRSRAFRYVSKNEDELIRKLPERMAQAIRAVQ